MAWFKVDDGLHSSRKVLSIPRNIRLAAIGLWTLAGSWSADEELDGFVPDYVVSEWGAPQKLVDALVKAGLWSVVDDGTQFVKWNEYQPTRADLEAERADKQTGGKLGNHKRWHVRRGVFVAGCEFCDSDNRSDSDPSTENGGNPIGPNPPDPSRPEQELPDGSSPPKAPPRGPRGERIPEPFLVTTEMRAWAAQEVPGVDVDRETRAFVDYWRGVPGARGRKLDWPATWRNRLRDMAGRQRGATPRPLTRTEQNMTVVERIAAREAATDQQKGISV